MRSQFEMTAGLPVDRYGLVTQRRSKTQCRHMRLWHVIKFRSSQFGCETLTDRAFSPAWSGPLLEDLMVKHGAPVPYATSIAKLPS